jgi:hypothetical protein
MAFIQHSFNHSCAIHTGFFVFRSSIVREPTMDIHSVMVTFVIFLAQ